MGAAQSELTENNVDTGFLQVHPVEVDEDESVPLQGGVTIGQRLLLGGDEPNIRDTRTAFVARGDTTPVMLDINGASAVRVTVVGSDPNDTDQFDDNFAVIRTDVDLEARTYSGSIQDLSGPNNRSQFAWSEQTLGSRASMAASVSGFIGNRRDVLIDETSSMLSISFPNDAPQLQYAVLVELLDVDDDSLIAAGSETEVLSTTAGTDARFMIPTDANVWVISGYGFRNGSNFRHERKMFSRIVVREDAGSLVASGLITMLAGRGVDETVTYAFSDYVLGTDDTGPFVSAAADTGSDTIADAVSRHDVKLYVEGSELVIEEPATIASNWTNMYNVQFLERTGAGSPARVLPTSFGLGDPNSVGGADFTFAIPAGATAGTIRYSAVFSDDVNENSGVSEIFVDLINNTSSGLAFGNRVTVGDLTAWSGVPLDTPTQLVTNSGLATGVVSNHGHLSEYTDPQWGGITVTRESTVDGEVIRVRTAPSSNQFNPYEFDGGAASWLGRQGIRLVEAPAGGSFSGGGFTVQPDGSVLLSVGAITSGLLRWTPPHNFNGSVELGVLLDNEPGVISTFDVIVNADDAEAETMDPVAVGDSDPAGNTVAEILRTSVNSPSADGNGIAIVAFSEVGTGTFEYSLDDGASWLPLGAVSQTSARLLGPNDRVRFVPDGTTEGTGTITYDAWDQSAFAAGELQDTTLDFTTVADADSTVFSVTPDTAQVEVRSACGNGFLEPGEGCDDNDLTGGDGCDAACLIELGEACGTGPVGLAGATSCASGLCDTSGGAPGICEAVGACGNSVLDAGEGCDDGNNLDGDDCSAACRIEDGNACNATAPGLTDAASCASGICDRTDGGVGTCEPADSCGNAVIEAGEGCDDGDAVDGDGCSATCLVESSNACNATAPGNVGAASCVSGICDVSSGAPGICEDANVCGNNVVEGAEACDDGNTSAGDGCSAGCLVENGNPCTGGDASCESGLCDLSSGAPGICEATNVCGNGRLEAGEGCDDGGLAAGDGCDASCRVENGDACNDDASGVTGAASCASGVCDVSGGAPGVCEPAGACGNGTLDAGEGCDDGDTDNGDGCNTNCRVEDGLACNDDAAGVVGAASCASGICDATEGGAGICEPGNTCGNNVLEVGEGCDDGGTTGGDGCSATCRIETSNACNTTAPGAVGDASCESGICDVSAGGAGICENVNTCGNNRLEAGEGCDDGGLVAGDGCNASCEIETGNPCNAVVSGAVGNASCESGICDTSAGDPGTCEAANECGNNVLEAGEGCDDGGTLDGDGCSAACGLEEGQACNDVAPGATGAASCASGICDVTTGAPGVCEPSGCGNGLLEAGEGCDDGDVIDGDGCSASCALEDGEACNDTAPGSTGGASCASGICDASEGGTGICEPANTCGNNLLEAGEGCDDGNLDADDGCAVDCRLENGSMCSDDATGLTGASSCSSGVCDESEGGTGVCEPEDTCGNGALEAGEGCDDGNTTPGDGCSEMCAIDDGGACNTNDMGAVAGSGCASGICDVSGNPVPGICEPADTCGNGVVEMGEGCDDGNAFSGDGCNESCLVENGQMCGDLVAGLTGDASCESGICNATAMLPGVCAPADACGNGVLEASEGCDDGNLTGGDGCGSDCTIENGNACNATAPGLMGSESCAGGLCSPDNLCVPALTCGNGVLESGEGCDDGDLEDGDGCNSNCLVENGGVCNARAGTFVGDAGCASGVCDETELFPGVCEPAGACGNSVLEDGEGCDDGNTTSGDGCADNCRVENGGACNDIDPGLTGSASCVTGFCADEGECRNPPACGDGRLDPGEGCDDGGTANDDGCNEFCLIEDGSSCNVTYPGVRLSGSCASGICNTTEGEPGTCATVGTCGNSVLDAGEGCDDGNLMPGDGCDETCRVESGFACNTTGPGDVLATSCASGICNDSAGVPGVCMDVDVCGNGVLETGEGCDDGNIDTGDGCDQLCLIENGAACSLRPEGLTDGDSCQSGVCDSAAGLPGVCEASNTCGNGTLEMGEGCDDGGTDPGDGCDASCLVELGDACNDDDIGAIENASCASGACDRTGGAPGVCVMAGICGNGVLETGEGCDDGGVDPDDGCDASCLVEIDAPCNALEPGALGDLSCASGLCNTGGGSPGVCRVPPGCGNGVLDEGEGCEDGNNEPGDGCSAACLVENGNACGADDAGLIGNASCASGSCDTSGGEPGLCVPVCGNNAVEDGEGCDDGGTEAGDGCNASCLVETDNACNFGDVGLIGDMSCATGLCDMSEGAPGVCAVPEMCGDGSLTASEGCDDGNTDDGDGCNRECRIETGQACNDDDAGLVGNESCASAMCDTSLGEPGTCSDGSDAGMTDAGPNLDSGPMADAGTDAGPTTPGVAGGALCSAGSQGGAALPWFMLAIVALRQRRD